MTPPVVSSYCDQGVLPCVGERQSSAAAHLLSKPRCGCSKRHMCLGGSSAVDKLGNRYPTDHIHLLWACHGECVVLKQKYSIRCASVSAEWSKHLSSVSPSIPSVIHA